MNFIAFIQGGEGEDIWDRQKLISAADFEDAAKQASAYAEDLGGQVVSLAQSDALTQTSVWKDPKVELPPSGDDSDVVLVRIGNMQFPITLGFVEDGQWHFADGSPIDTNVLGWMDTRHAAAIFGALEEASA